MKSRCTRKGHSAKSSAGWDLPGVGAHLPSFLSLNTIWCPPPDEFESCDSETTQRHHPARQLIPESTIHNELVPSIYDTLNLSTTESLTDWNSQGNCQLRQAPQQDPRPVQTLRYVQEKERYLSRVAVEGLRPRQHRANTDGYRSTGSRSLHVQKKTCSNCGYPSASIRKCTFTPHSHLAPRLHPSSKSPTKPTALNPTNRI